MYFCSEEGRITVIAPGDELEILAESELDDGILASPAITGSSLLLRTRSFLYRIDP
jgi:hypothetical protein